MTKSELESRCFDPEKNIRTFAGSKMFSDNLME